MDKRFLESKQNIFVDNTCILWTNVTKSYKVHGKYSKSRPDTVVDIATGYGLDGPGIESR
jgi:hypothetical protein